jgi:tRNA threonylcarbamoyl adenosine modification protein (Sua5/YciO/YrdC/YwlC family)
MFVAARVFSLSHSAPRENGIKAAQAALAVGRAVVFPTDTSYALAVRAMDESAVNLLWNIKGQTPKTPLTIFIANIGLINKFCAGITDEAKLKYLHFWPGSLTLILKGLNNLLWNKGIVPNVVSVRMPLHPVAHEIMGDLEILATTSPNKVGQVMGKNIDDIKAQFGNEVAVYLDAGELNTSMPSSILDLTSPLPVLVRQGSVSLAEIALVIENVVMEVEDLSGNKEQQASN